MHGSIVPRGAAPAAPSIAAPTGLWASARWELAARQPQRTSRRTKALARVVTGRCGRPRPGVSPTPIEDDCRVGEAVSQPGAAFRRRLISYNPASQVELDPEPVRQRDKWTPGQLATFLAHASADRLGAPFRLFAFTGIRRGECCGLRWSDVDLDAGTMTISQQLTQSGEDRVFGEPKTKFGARAIALDKNTVAALRSHRAAQAAERLAFGPAYNPRGLSSARRTAPPSHRIE